MAIIIRNQESMVAWKQGREREEMKQEIREG